MIIPHFIGHPKLDNYYGVAPPELAADIYNTGIYLAGGGSMLRGLDQRLSLKTDLPVYIAEDPLQAVVRGTGIALKNIETREEQIYSLDKVIGIVESNI